MKSAFTIIYISVSIDRLHKNIINRHKENKTYNYRNTMYLQYIFATHIYIYKIAGLYHSPPENNRN